MARIIRQSVSLLLIAGVVFLSCMLLFYAEHRTTSIHDLFNPGNFVALLIYFFPAMAICSYMYSYLLISYKDIVSLFLSLVSGIPLSFILVLSLLHAIG